MTTTRLPRRALLQRLLGPAALPVLRYCGPAHAGTSASPPPSAGVVQRVLPNGVTVLVREDHASRIAAVSAVVRAGARHETRATAGLRAFTQELLLRGTAQRPREVVFDRIERLGATLDAEVGDDFVELWATGAGTDLDTLLTLLAPLLIEPALAPAEIEAVRAALMARLVRNDDDFLERLASTVRGRLFRDEDGEPTHHGLPPLGFADAVQRMQREDLVDFHRTHYVGPRLVVAISGAVSAEAVLRSAATAFAAVPARSAGQRATVDSPPLPYRGQHVAVLASPAPQAWVALGFAVPGFTHPDYPVLAVMASLLGRGLRSRLYHEFRERTTLAYEVGAELSLRAEVADFIAFAQVEALLVEEAKNRIRSQLELLRSEPVPAAELERARRVTAGAFLLAHQRNRQRAHFLARFEALGVGHQFDADYPNRVRRVTADDLRRVANVHFEHCAVVVALPDPTLTARRIR